MSVLRIELKKGRGGPDALACVRGDGSRTWERLQRGIAVHDLVHFAVERGLGLRSGFYGLVASGWSITDFADREVLRALPKDAIRAEHLVGFFWRELGQPPLPDLDTFNAALASVDAAEPGLDLPRLTQAELDGVRAEVRSLVERWNALEPGATLALEFSPGSP